MSDLQNMDTSLLEKASPVIEWFSSMSEEDPWEIRESIVLFDELVQVTHGNCFYRIDGIQCIVSAGDFLVIPAGARRMATEDTEQPASGFITAARFVDDESRDVRLPFSLISHVNPDEELLDYYVRFNLVWTQRLPGYMLYSRALLMLILHWYLSHLLFGIEQKRQDPRVDHAIEYMVHNYARPLHVSDLAEQEGLNPVYFGTLFRTVTGLPVRSFLNRVRINNAEALIAGGGLSVEEAARRCGFDDVFYFSKVFKRLRGYNPSQIRTRRPGNGH